MGDEDRGAAAGDERVERRTGDGDAVVRRRAPSQFVEHDERLVRRVLEGHGRALELVEERRPPRGQRVGRAHAREDRVPQGKRGSLREDRGARLRVY